MSARSQISPSSNRLKVKPKVFFTQDSGVRCSFDKKIINRIFEKIAFYLKNPQTSVELHLVRSAAMKVLNKEFRGKNKETDVLSFGSSSKDLLGSIVIDIDTAKKQAKEYKHHLEREIQELFIHGVLHLLGYDHETEKEREVMKRYENYFSSWLDRFSKRTQKKRKLHHS